jgi:hypothetical protein
MLTGSVAIPPIPKTKAAASTAVNAFFFNTEFTSFLQLQNGYQVLGC